MNRLTLAMLCIFFFIVGGVVGESKRLQVTIMDCVGKVQSPLTYP